MGRLREGVFQRSQMQIRGQLDPPAVLVQRCGDARRDRQEIRDDPHPLAVGSRKHKFTDRISQLMTFLQAGKCADPIGNVSAPRSFLNYSNILKNANIL